MLKTRKLFHGLALAGALILGSASSFAQVCSGIMTTTNLGVRPEGLTELAGDIVVNCQAAPGTPTGGTFLPSDFSVLVQLTNGVSITNTATTGTGAPSLLVTDDGAPVVNGSVAYPSGLPNSISFTVTGAGTGSSNAFTISGIRMNANQASSAGIASVYATLVITTVSETGTTVLPLSNNPSLVATILPKSLNFSIIGGTNAGESFGAASFPTCLEGVNVSGFFRFSENFSNVLRNQAQEGAGATNATYLRVVLSDVPAGVTVLVPNSAFSTGNNVLTPVSGIGSSSASGINGFYIPRSGDTAYSGSYGTAGAEIIYSVETIIGGTNSTATLDTLSIPFIARYTAGPSIGIGTASAKGTLAPVGSTTAIPRFADVGDSANAFSTSICSTTLLYPYVTTAAGFDTGIAIANTTADPSPLATPNQSGTCTINPYGSYDSGATVPAAGESPVINAGRVWAFSLTDSPAFGSGARIGPGFSGYLIAQCNFQLAHGFAFVSDFGASRVAEGYLALVLNSNTGSRVSGATIERLSH